MTRIALTLFLLVASFGCLAAEARQPFEGPRPIAVLLISDPWSMVIGADTPRFALYEDGRVIYVEQTSVREYMHMEAHLASQELANVKATLLGFAKEPVSREIDVRPGSTDQPESLFFLDVDGHKLVTSVYGLGARADADREPTPLPAGIRDLHRYLTEFRVPVARKWIPDQLEVMLWDYSYAPEASIRWPATWPGLSDPTTQKRGDAYSIFLAGTEEQALRTFLANRKSRGAVEIDGKKWAVSYRPVFPAWREAFPVD
jgi:hypothetical protein